MSTHNICFQGTRQFIDKTTHRHGFWRHFTDTIEDNSSTLFEDNSPTHYYVEIIPKLKKWRQYFENKLIYYHVYDQNNEFRILIQYFFGLLMTIKRPFQPHRMAGVNKLTHLILKAWFKGKYTYRELGKILFKTFLIKIKKMETEAGYSFIWVMFSFIS